MNQPQDASAAATPETGAWGWVARRQTKLVWIVLVVAAVLRLISTVELSDSPVKTLNGFADSDMAFFNAWSIQLAKGNDVLSDGQLRHPIHTWHRQVAAEHLSVHPELFADRVGGRSWDELQPMEQLNEQALLWNEWYGPAFHQEPLYPYLMAVIYGLFGHEDGDRIWLIQMLQILVGVVTIALLYQVTVVYFGSQVRVAPINVHPKCVAAEMQTEECSTEADGFVDALRANSEEVSPEQLASVIAEIGDLS